jgi:phosphonate transport system substrate-binding protein
MRLFCALLLSLSVVAAAPAAELTVGLIPEQNVFRQKQLYDPLGAWLGQRAGVEVRFTILSRYGNILESFQEKSMDGAFWGSFTGALAIQRLGVEPLARPVWKDGTSTYHGLIFVRRDSGISSPADMKGRTLAFVDRATTAGYVFPVAWFRENGVADLSTHLRETFFAGSHDAAIAAVLDGKADIGCAKNTIFHSLAARDPRVERDLVILARSPDVPSNALGVRSDLPGELKERLRAALLGMTSDPEGREVLASFGALKFVATSRDDYAPVFDMASKAGIDLSAYDYRNQ